MKRWQDKWHYQLVDKLEHELPQRADVVTTLSTYLSRLAQERGAREVELIYNGFWPDSKETQAAPRSEVRKEFSLHMEAFYLAFTGFTLAEFDWCLDLLAHFADESADSFGLLRWRRLIIYREPTRIDCRQDR